MIHQLLLPSMLALRASRPPDFTVGPPADPYMSRWFVVPRDNARDWNAYLHEFHHSDDDRALHDHPGDSVSILLRGGYVEWQPVPEERRITQDAQPGVLWVTEHEGHLRQEGDIVFRRGEAAHRIELIRGQPHTTLTLFLFGPKFREWGFHCPQGWRPWQEFTASADENDPRKGEVGRGCN